jgi:hypothetical protein
MTQFQLTCSGGCQQPGQATEAGSPPAVEAAVVAEMLDESGDPLPAASRALTRNEYVVDGDNPATVADVPFAVATGVALEPWNTS